MILVWASSIWYKPFRFIYTIKKVCSSKKKLGFNLCCVICERHSETYVKQDDHSTLFSSVKPYQSRLLYIQKLQYLHWNFKFHMLWRPLYQPRLTLYHSEYVAFNDLRVMLLQIGWVGIPTAPAWLPTEMLIEVLQTVSFIGYSIVIPTAPARPSLVFDYLSFVWLNLDQDQSSASPIQPWIIFYLAELKFLEAFPG